MNFLLTTCLHSAEIFKCMCTYKNSLLITVSKVNDFKWILAETGR